MIAIFCFFSDRDTVVCIYLEGIFLLRKVDLMDLRCKNNIFDDGYD